MISRSYPTAETLLQRWERATRLCRLVFAGMLLTLNGCYMGAVGVAVLGVLASDDSGGSGSGNSPVDVLDLQVLETKTAPARILFTLVDEEEDPVDVELYYTPSQASEDTLLQVRLVGEDDDLTSLPTSREGIQYERLWGFAEQVASGPAYEQGYSLRLKVDGREFRKRVDLGNDPPALEVSLPWKEEYGETVLARLHASDSSNDEVSVLVEYALVDADIGSPRSVADCPAAEPVESYPPRSLPEEPGVSWNIAHRVSIEDCPPLFAVPPRRAPFDEDFLWDVLGDLGEVECYVRMRFTPYDGTLWGGTLELEEPLHLDNDQRPIAILDGESFVLNPDRHRCVPIPFSVRDPESDSVLLVFQWRRADQSFEELPPLPESRSAVEEILADPRARRERQIATEAPLEFTGSLIPLGNRRFRLPELQSTCALLRSGRLEGRTLDLLRPSRFSVLEKTPWALQKPVAAVPQGDGRTALVLDTRTGGAWRLQDVTLAGHQESRVVVPHGFGRPSALTLEPGGATALVATSTGTAWWIWRVDLETGGVKLIHSAPASRTEGDRVRAILPLGSEVSLITVGSCLLRLSYAAEDDVRATVLLDNLETPWGLAVDPRAPRRVHVSERDWTHPATGESRGRVFTLGLDSLAITPVSTPAGGPPRPTSLSLDRRGTHLLVVTDEDPDDGTSELRVLPTARTGSVRTICILDGHIGSLTVGPDRLQLMTLTDRNTIAVSGGLEQRRSIVEASPDAGQVTLDGEPDSAGRRWRIRHHQTVLQPDPEGSRGAFVWDTSDVIGGQCNVVLRVVPYDNEKGVEDSSGVPRPLARFDEAPWLVRSGVTGAPFNAAGAADIDCDGNLDIVAVSRESDLVTVFFQTGQREFVELRNSVLQESERLSGPVSLLLEDLDRDGDVDIACANKEGRGLTVFFQADPVPRGFATERILLLDGEGVSHGTDAVIAADLDGDGNMDLITASEEDNILAGFLQTAPGVFNSTPLLIGGPGTTDGPLQLRTGDFDDDGDLDIVSANSRGDSLTVLYQDSHGEFPLARAVLLGGPGTTDSPHAVVADDLDGDGDLDIACANAGDDTIAVFQQVPGRQFAFALKLAPGSLETTDAFHCLVTADLDGNGRQDVVCRNVANESLTAFLQRTTGFLTGGNEPSGPDVILSADELSGESSVLFAVDLDRDGDQDLVSGCPAEGSVAIFFQNTDGSLVGRDSPDLILGGPGTTPGPEALAAGDLDRDGDLDVIVADREAGTLAAFLQSRPGVLGVEGETIRSDFTLGGPAVTPEPTAVVIADLDCNGWLDVASTSYRSRGESPQFAPVTVFLQQTAGGFQDAPLKLGEGDVGAQSLAAGDLDRNGYPDLVAAFLLTGQLAVFYQSAPGVFSEEPVTIDAWRPMTLALGHFNQDERLDIVAGDFENKELLVFLQTEQGGFMPHQQSPIGCSDNTDGPRMVLATDVNGDGYTDIVSANKWNRSLSVFYQYEGMFKAPLQVTAPHEHWSLLRKPVTVDAGDLDGDGRLDLVCGSLETNHLDILHQSALGDFPDHLVVSLGGSPESMDPAGVLIVDLDGDGDLDVLSVNRGSCNLTVFQGGR